MKGNFMTSLLLTMFLAWSCFPRENEEFDFRKLGAVGREEKGVLQKTCSYSAIASILILLKFIREN